MMMGCIYWMSAHALMCMCALGLGSGSAHRTACVGGVKVRVWSGFRKRARALIEAHALVV
jgi:hypothetical protein